MKSKDSLRLFCMALGVAALFGIGGKAPWAAQRVQEDVQGLEGIASRAKGDDCMAIDTARSVRSVRTGFVRFVGTEAGHPIQNSSLSDAAAVSPEEASRSYLQRCGSFFGIAQQADELTVLRSSAEDGRSFVRFQQQRQGIPVIGAEFIVNLDGANNLLAVVGKGADQSSPIDVAPSVDPSAASETALDLVARTYGLFREKISTARPELWIYEPGLLGPRTGSSKLVWRIEAAASADLPIRELVLVDAHQGSVVLNFNQTETVLNRQTYTAGNGSTLPGTLVCNETNPTCAGGDSHAAAAHNFAGDTYNFYFNNHGRNSIDNAGLILKSTVHYQVGYQNAFWDPTLKQMVYGDGFGFALADDVVGHELTHGVTQFTSNLFYYYQSGAINESLSDVWGEFVDQTNGKGTDNATVDWMLGEDVTGAGAVRNMRDPTLFSDPDKMTSVYYTTSSSDNGGVHTNSGVNNKAAYLMVTGGAFNGQAFTGLGLTKVAKIYYEVQTHLLTSGSDYNDLYEALYQGCNNLVGTSGIVSADCIQVRKATLAVEMHLQPVADFNPDTTVCSSSQTPTNLFFDNFESGSGSVAFAASQGTVRWRLDSPYGVFAHSGTHFLYADDAPASLTDTTASMTSGVAIPANAYLHFAHAFDFDTPNNDGGVLEYSVNGGTTWVDAGMLFEVGGYRGQLASSNPLAGRSAFIGSSHGYISSRLNLSSLAGQNIRFRWRMALNSSLLRWGWWLDDVRMYSCSGGSNTPPTISAISDQNINTNGSTGALAFTVGDGETVPNGLIVSAASSNTTLVPNSNITLGGANTSRTVTVVPAALQSGTATILLTVSDGVLSTQRSFVLTVASTAPGTVAGQVKVAGTGAPIANAVVSFSPGGSAATTASTGNYTISLPAGTYTATVLAPGYLNGAAMGVVVSGGATTNLDFSLQPAVTATAAYDSTLKAPRCSTASGVCDAGVLLNGRASITGGPEPNQPNTILTSCADGTSGAYHVNESIDRLVVSTLDGSALGPGKTARIDATVWAASSSDFLDLYYAANAMSPSWIFIATVAPPALGAQTLSANYVLPTGATQAVRGNFRQSGSANICTSGSFNDRDDLIFSASSSNTAPTISAIANQTVGENTATGAIAFTVGDAETAVSGLTVSGSSSNTLLAPISNISFGGNGASRTLIVTPAPDQYGQATIAVVVSDGALTASVQFTLTVSATIHGATASLVQDAVTGAPIPGALVIFSPGGHVTATGLTGSALKSVPSGTYTLTASAPGHILQSIFGVVVPLGGTINISFSLPPSPTTSGGGAPLLAQTGDFTKPGLSENPDVRSFSVSVAMTSAATGALDDNSTATSIAASELVAGGLGAVDVQSVVQSSALPTVASPEEQRLPARSGADVHNGAAAIAVGSAAVPMGDVGSERSFDVRRNSGQLEIGSAEGAPISRSVPSSVFSRSELSPPSTASIFARPVVPVTRGLVVSARSTHPDIGDPEKWEIEVHGGAAFAGSGGGDAQLPKSGSAFTTANGKASRANSSWFFGDGALLLNQVHTTMNLPQRIAPLNDVLGASGVQPQLGAVIGARISRVVNPRFAAEGTLEFSLKGPDFSIASLEAIEASRSSFKSAWEGLTSSGGFGSASVTSTSNVQKGGGSQLLATGAAIIALRSEGKFIPYLAAGGGVVSNFGETPSATLEGRYKFLLGGVTPVDETDTVKLHYSKRLAPVVLAGGGVKYYLSSRMGVRIDVREVIVLNKMEGFVDATPAIATGSPAGSGAAATSPSIQFVNDPSIGLQSSLGGGPIKDFRTFSGGIQRRLNVGFGVFWRF